MQSTLNSSTAKCLLILKSAVWNTQTIIDVHIIHVKFVTNVVCVCMCACMRVCVCVCVCVFVSLSLSLCVWATIEPLLFYWPLPSPTVPEQ